MQRLSFAVDRLVGWLKWPTAAIALLLLPGIALALWELIKRVLSSPAPILPFLGGAVAYVILWRLVLRHRIFGTYFSTLEHELTHAVLSKLCLPLTACRPQQLAKCLCLVDITVVAYVCGLNVPLLVWRLWGNCRGRKPDSYLHVSPGVLFLSPHVDLGCIQRTIQTL